MKIVNSDHSLQLLRKEVSIEDYRKQMDRLESLLKKEKLEEYQKKQREMVVSANRVDVYV